MLNTVILQFLVVASLVFILTYAQSVVQTWASERVAKDLRTRLAAKISVQSFAWVEQLTPAKLLTNLTSDVDSVKMFVSQAIASIISSLFLIVGASVLLLSINWRLGLGILGVVPFIAITFQLVLRKVRTLFRKAQEAIDWLNRVINESILGASLIRLLNTQQIEYQKFMPANAEARDIGLSILRLFASLIPSITLADQCGDRDHPAAGRPFRDRRQHEPGRFHGLQLLSRDPDLPDHSHRLHEQRHRAGLRLLHAHRRDSECSRRGEDRTDRRRFARRRRHGRCLALLRREDGAEERFVRSTKPERRPPSSGPPPREKRSCFTC